MERKPTLLHCRGYSCSCTELIDAHIIPRAFARDIMGDGANKRITSKSSGTAKQQLGEFDNGILCARCDGILGQYDDYAIEVCRNFVRDRVELGNGNFEVPNFDGDRFATFVLAVLWRASISKRHSFAPVSLGPYETKARDVLFGVKPLSSFPQFELIVERYQSTVTDPTKFYFHPVRQKFNKWNSYGLGLGGFRMVAKVSNERLPEEFRYITVNGNAFLRGWYVDLQSTSEYEAILDIVRGHQKRKNSG